MYSIFMRHLGEKVRRGQWSQLEGDGRSRKIFLLGLEGFDHVHQLEGRRQLEGAVEDTGDGRVPPLGVREVGRALRGGPVLDRVARLPL